MAKVQQKTTRAPKTIVTDGAKFSLKGHIPQQKHGWRKISNNVQLKYRHYGNRQFQIVAEVYLDKERVGELEAVPRSLLDPDTVLFTADNRIQYSKGWTKKIRAAWSDLTLDFSHVNRLDLAVDELAGSQFGFIKRLVTGSIRSVGKTVFSPRYEGRDEKGRAKLTYFTFGSRSSGKFLRAYYKRQEIERSNKQYIEDFWAANGFELQDEEEVARFEIVLKREELKKYPQFEGMGSRDLILLEDPQYLATLFQSAQKGFFEFVWSRDLKKDSNISRARRLKILNLDEICTCLLEKIRRKSSNFIYNAKMSAKLLYMLYCKTGEEAHYRQVEEILKNFHLGRWFVAQVDKFYQEFSSRMDGPGFEYLKVYTADPEFVQMQVWETHNFTK